MSAHPTSMSRLHMPSRVGGPDKGTRMRRRSIATALVVLVCGTASLGWRQYSVGPSASPARPVVAATVSTQAPAAANPHGSADGLGYHDPRSAVPRLVKRTDVIDWETLATVKARLEGNRIVAEFPEAVKALDRKTVKVQGYMLPLTAGAAQDRFLLSAVPTSCPFCIPAGPEGLIEVRTKGEVRYTVNPLVVEGRLAVLHDAKEGLFYRIDGAIQSD